uniref:Uncharacterized protein n=1 Tax=candidate division CPR3 bacterium TaxID=2268181 RepID=A0A7C4M0F1_UNCC3
MENRKKISLIGKYFTITIFVVSLIIAGKVNASGGLGIVPANITEDKLTRGSVLEKTINITREDTKEALKAKVTTNIPGADDWISINGGNNFTLKAGEKITPLRVKIKVPEKAEYKDYKGSIDIVISPSSLDGTVAVAPGLSVATNLKVIEQKINSFLIKNVFAKDTYEGENISLTLGLKNTGNIATAPTKAELDFYTINKENLLTTKQNVREIEKVDPFTTGVVEVVFDTNGIAPDNYWGKLRVYNGSQVVGEYDVSLTILPKELKGTLAGRGLLGDLLAKLLSGGLASVVNVLLLLVLIVLVVVIIKRATKKEKAKKMKR